MSIFDAMKEVWDVVDNTREAADKNSPFVERIGNGMSAGGGALTGMGSLFGVPALSVAGPLIAAGGMGMEIGSFADEHLGLSDKASDAMVGDSDEQTWAQGMTPAHFRGEAGNAEARLLNTGRQQSFLKDETARQVQISGLIQQNSVQGAFNPLPKQLLRAQGIDMPNEEDRGPFAHWAH